MSGHCFSWLYRWQVVPHFCLVAAPWLVFKRKNGCRLQKTKRLRQLFEQMDKHKTGALTLDQFKEYMARENPRSVERAAAIFATMGSKHQEYNPEEGCKPPTVSFLEVLVLRLIELKLTFCCPL
jgi:hypothetical protein